MSDDKQNTEQQTDPLEANYSAEQLAVEDALQRRRTAVQLDETERHAIAKKERQLSRMSTNEFRDHVLQKYGYDPG
jgi:hypothetical protein